MSWEIKESTMLGIEFLVRMFLLTVGVSMVTAFLLGSLGIIDFYVCIKPVGECIKH